MREVRYIPKDVQAKKEREMKKRELSGNYDSEKRRRRRGIKELGFKTPFKNQK